MIVSSIPGRIRIRHDSLKDLETSTSLSESLRKRDGISSIKPNITTGSMLICFRPEIISLSSLRALIKDFSLDQGKSGSASRPWNRSRTAKRGMLTCLGMALAMAGLDQEDAHVLFGLGFLGFLGLHLNIHKNRVLK
ncbi:HMA2 domain-containing protein [Desulfonatronovibrio hydrogenovorans]|uniref:HMA2 domain-containing protein n=1 Tax=Desulfonatronovibrio hydrogenovorans TaxID=53245 RepID=UPI00048E618E|nr:hypothetical protein [Desulfonatronovibrio hydrogenovorans]